MELYKKMVASLKSDNSSKRIQGSEEIRDLYEFKYQYLVPSKDLVTFLTAQLIKSIIIEEEEKVQYEMLDALYAWSWFDSDNNESINLLVNNFDKLLSIDGLSLALEVLIASGDVKYKSLYEKYLINDFKGIRSIAKKGIASVKQGNGTD